MTKLAFVKLLHILMPTKMNNIKNQKSIEQIVNFTNIAKTMSECLWVGDKRHKTVYVNPVFEKTSGYTLTECIGKDCDYFFDKEGKESIKSHHKLRKSGKSSQYEATMISRSGEKFPLFISGASTKTGGTIGIFINLKKLKILEKEKRLAEQIVKNSTEAIVVLDQKKRIKLWNSGAEGLFGFKENEVINKKINPLLVPPEKLDENEEIIKNLDLKGFIKGHATKRITKKGKSLDVSLSITKVTDKNKEFIGYLAFYKDITTKKNLSNQLQKRFEAIQDAYKELGFQKRQNNYIFEITEAAAGKSSMQGLGQLILSAATMLTKCDGATLRIYDNKTNSIKLSSCIGVGSNWKGRSKMAYENSLAEEAFKNKRPLLIHDLESTPKHRGLKIAKEHGFKACITLPLIINKKFIGVINLYSTNPGNFRLIETDFLERFTSQCSLAVFTKLQAKKTPTKKK